MQLDFGNISLGLGETQARTFVLSNPSTQKLTFRLAMRSQTSPFKVTTVPLDLEPGEKSAIAVILTDEAKRNSTGQVNSDAIEIQAFAANTQHLIQQSTIVVRANVFIP